MYHAAVTPMKASLYIFKFEWTSDRNTLIRKHNLKIPCGSNCDQRKASSDIFIPPVYEVYRGYIVFCFFSVFVCVFVNFFSVKDVSGTTWPRILKFDTKLGNDKLYCVTKNQPHIAYQSFICPFFFLSNKNFCHTFLSFYRSLGLQTLYTPRGWPSILCKRKSNCWCWFCLLFPISFFFIYQSYCNAYGHFPSKISQGTTWPRIMKFCTKLWYNNLYCVTMNQPHMLFHPFLSSFFFLSNKNLCHRFLSSCWSQSL